MVITSQHGLIVWTQFLVVVQFVVILMRRVVTALCTTALCEVPSLVS